MQLKANSIFTPFMTVSQDTELFKAAQKGDVKAFEKLFKLYYQRLCTYSNKLVKDVHEAEEVVQHVFVQIWNNIATIQIETSIQAYLYRAVNNYSLNKIKQLQNRKRLNHEIAYLNNNRNSEAGESLLENELTFQLNKAIDTLPDQCRLVFQLSRFESMKYQEIAHELGISIKTVENQIGKALKLLREELKDYLPLLLIYLSHYIH